MNAFRRTVAVGMLAAAACGCKSNGFGTLGRVKPPATAAGVNVADAVARHNRDAQLITSYQANPGVAVSPQTGRNLLPGGAAEGSLFIEPPSNFRLVLKAMFKERLDIGSNQDRFWLWSPEPFGDVVYTCSYGESGSVPLPGLYQPDWIMEAMGLQPLPDPDSGEGVSVRADGNDAILEQRRTGPDGQQLIKETVIRNPVGQIAEHRLVEVGRDGKRSPIARAIVQEYRRFPLGPDESGTARTVELPSKFRLLWPAEQMDVTVSLNKVRLNAGFDPQKQALYFNVPDNKGPQRDLREALGLSADPGPGNEAIARDVAPAVPASVRLGEPVSATTRRPPRTSPSPSRVERTALVSPSPSSRRRADDDIPSLPATDRLVGSGLPRSPSHDFEPVATEDVPNWRASRGLRP